MEKIRLDRRNHKYWLGDINVPGFSEVIRAMGISGNPFWTPEARVEGTALSEWALYLAQGKDPEAEPDPRISGRVAGFKKFLVESKFKFVGGEEPLYEPNLKYACTDDLHGHIGAFSAVIEVKRGAKEPWHKIQTAAQKLALAANGFKVQKRYALYLKDGDYRLVEYSDPQDEANWKAIVAGYHARVFYL